MARTRTRIGIALTAAVGLAMVSVAPASTALAGPGPGGAVRLASVDANGVLANGRSGDFALALSANGRFVAFLSFADNLVTGDLNGAVDAFVKDRVTGRVERVSISSTGAEADGSTDSVSISADGQYVAFSSYATNLVPSDLNGVRDAFVRDRVGKTTTRVSVSAQGVEANEQSLRPEISANGAFVAFYSLASNLAPGDTNNMSDVFVKYLGNGGVDRVSMDNAGRAANGASSWPVISADGRFVAYTSTASNLVPNDTNSTADVFVRDRSSRITERVSVSSVGVEGNGSSQAMSISADGKRVGFQSAASNLAPADLNGYRDIFVRDRGSGSTIRVSVSSTGAEANENSHDARMSADGRYVAFLTDARNLSPADTDFRRDLYIRDLTAGTTTLASARRDGTKADHHSAGLAISGDGTTVAFTSEAVNLNPLVPLVRPQVYVRSAIAAGPDPNCDFGESSIVCELLYADGVGPVTVRWYVNNVHAPSVDDQVVAVHPCTQGQDLRITVRVSDANGPIESSSAVMACLTDAS